MRFSEALRPAALALACAAGAMAAPPNVVLIITDQQTADALSFRMGRDYIHTPALDRLAARGTYFSRAYAPNPLCMPARNSFITGRFPHETGVTDNAAQHDGRTLDPEEFVTLGTHFARAGYRTGYYGKWHLAYDRDALETHGFFEIDTQQQDDTTARYATEFLAGRDERPFFLVASFLNPHDVAQLSRGQRLPNGPVGEPPPLDQRPPAPTNLAPPAHEPDTMEMVRRGYHANMRLFPIRHFTPSMWRALRWGYYRLVEKVDAEIGRVLDALDAAGLTETTVIVFLSDHGECAGAHGLTQKTVFYEESVRVPMIVSVPGQEARQSDAFVNMGVDLMPTLLDYAGIAIPAHLPGRSLRPLVAGETVDDWRDEVIIGNHMSQGDVIEEGFVPITEGRMVRTARYKYCVYQHGESRESLIDLIDDPGEMVDLARDPAYRHVLLEHRERLRRFGVKYDDALVDELLADDVGPRPFDRIVVPRRPTDPFMPPLPLPEPSA
jgi:arylsulfatase A-like enzyme